MSEQKHGLRKYVYPPKDELSHLYLEKDFTHDELAKHYGLPRYTISYIISIKYNLKKTDYRGGAKRIKIKLVEDKGLTKKILQELYLDKLWTPYKIGKEYDEQPQYIGKLLGYWDIPKRTKSEGIKLAWDKRKEEKEKKLVKERSFIRKKVDKIKKDIKSGKIDPSEITHKNACILLSCDPGIEKLKKMCDLYGFDFQILSNTYKKLEPVWYKLNLYPDIKIKIALTLHYRYKISKYICSEICHITDVSFRDYYDILEKRVKLTKAKRENPLPIINIRWLFDNPNLPEIYKTLFTFKENYTGYYCNIDNRDCEYFEEWNHRCYKPKFFRCQYSFCKFGKEKQNRLEKLRTKYDKKEEKDNG